MNNDEYFIGENERAYVNPTLSRDERLAFVDTLRNTMGANTAQINNATERLGTRIPSSMGGLTGSNAYFTQRYQTPFMESTANQLKATAQAKALNDLMENAERQWANRMQQAYRGAKRRATAASASNTATGASEQVTPDEFDQTSSLSVTWEPGDPTGLKTTMGIDNDYYYTRTSDGKLYATNDPNYVKRGGYYYPKSQIDSAYSQINKYTPGLTLLGGPLVGAAQNLIMRNIYNKAMGF